MSIVKASKPYTQAHHFDSVAQEYRTAKFGVWMFMVTEILMFGGLFVAFGIFNNIYPEIFTEGAKFLDWKLGAINTVVLITSSLTMALGIHYIQTDKRDMAFWSLVFTVLCGAVFMVIKYFEYSHKFHLGLFPGSEFAYEGTVGAKNLALFFSFYFCMTGLHGIHVLVGMGLISWVCIRHYRGEFSPNHYTAVEGVGLFWHIVDLIWIYLFPLLYLV